MFRAIGTEPSHRAHVRRLVRDVRLVERRRPPRGEVGEEPPVLRRRGRGGVRRRRRVDREHRSVGGADEVLGPSGEQIGRVILGRGAEALDGAVDGQRVPEVLGVHERDPAVPSGRHVAGERVGLIRVQVLPEEAGAVPAGAECGRDRGRVIERLEATVREALPVHAGRVRILAGQDRRPARAAERARRERLGERDPSLDQRALDLRHRPERVPSLVVRDDEEDRGRFLFLCDRGRGQPEGRDDRGEGGGREAGGPRSAPERAKKRGRTSGRHRGRSVPRPGARPRNSGAMTTDRGSEASYDR